MPRSEIKILLNSGSKIDEMVLDYIRGLMYEILAEVPDEVVARHGEVGWLARKYGVDQQRLRSIWTALDSDAGEGYISIWDAVRQQRRERLFVMGKND